MKLTKEEISLCKQVAEKYTAESGEGDWFIYEDPESKAGWSRPTLNKSGHQPQYGYGKNIPLWTISDCLEFLRERNYTISLQTIFFSDTKLGYYYEAKSIGDKKSRFKASNWIYEYGKTPLEACLKVVLVVLEENDE